MRPVLIEWRGIRIHSYPVMLYLGMICAVIGSNYSANMKGMDSLSVYIAMVLLTIPGLVGARLLFVAIHWSTYRRQCSRIWSRSEGGAAMQGGLAMAVLVSVPLLSALPVPLGAFWDVATFGMLIWLIVGRLGCLLHGCCGGRSSAGPFALYLPDHHGVWRHRIPTQLLEAACAFLLIFGAAGLWSLGPPEGIVFLSALGAYSIVRWVLQPLRDTQERLASLNVHRTIALAYAVLSIGCALYVWLGKR